MSESKNHPVVREHPDQKRQEQSGREDATDPKDVGGNDPASDSAKNTNVVRGDDKPQAVRHSG